jgi:hypothetical protein
MSLFQSFFLGGFEGSTHKLKTGKRLDMVAASGHVRFARQDYERLKAFNIMTARESLRWHLIEQSPGRYHFNSAMLQMDAARAGGAQVIWDLFHYGYPDFYDIWSPAFIDVFARYARAWARFYKNETDEPLFMVPVNEISFMAYGNDEGFLNPFGIDRGHEMKRQLVRCAIAAIEAVRDEVPPARFVHIDPLIHIHPNPRFRDGVRRAAEYNNAQFQGYDMLAGRIAPELGGDMKYLDIIGLCYYERNQWIDQSSMVTMTSKLYRPLRELLAEVHRRYGRPFFIGETGTEDGRRARWFNYVCSEVKASIEAGTPVQGITLYPILNHPGWDDERHCHNGLWDYADDCGEREVHMPLAEELRRQQERFAKVLHLLPNETLEPAM